MSITAKEIAKLLNVSPAAVSLALNGKPGVSDITREKIISTALKYDYTVPQQQHASVSTRNIRYVIYIGEGLVVKEISFHYIVLQGIEAMAKKLGYNVLVSYLYHNQNEADQFEEIFQNTAGIVLLGTEFNESTSLLKNPLIHQHSDVPIVIVDNMTFRSSVDCIYTDNLQGAYIAIEHLINQGHTDIGYFSSIQRIWNFEMRKEGVQRALAEHPEASLNIVPVDFSTEKAYRDICQWLESKPDLPTAFFADSDVIAFGAIRAFHKFGYRIPQDISIIGFDDMPACEMISPPLTTVRVLKMLMGSKAVEVLHQRISEQSHTSEETAAGVFRTAISTCIKSRHSVMSLRKESVDAHSKR